MSAYVLFHSQITLLMNASDRLTFAGESEEDIYNQAIQPIIEKTEQLVDMENFNYPLYGDKFAELSIGSLSKNNEPVLNCDDYSQLKYGWGRAYATRYPGEGGKIVMAGHSYKNKNLTDIKIGAEITLKTTYGTFTYRVTETKIIKATDATIMKADDSKEQLVLYTCYPANQIGTDKRFVIFSELVKGPKLINIPFQ